MHVNRSRREQLVREINRLNLTQAKKKAGVHKLAQAQKKAGVHKDERNDETEVESCSETESKMGSEDKAQEPREKTKHTPIPLGMLSLQVATTQAVNELVRRVYNESGDETPIIVHEDKVEATGAIMAQLSLKKGLQEWGESAEKSTTKKCNKCTICKHSSQGTTSLCQR